MSKDGCVSIGEAIDSFDDDKSAIGILIHLMQIVPRDKLREETDPLCNLSVEQMREKAKEIARRYVQ